MLKLASKFYTYDELSRWIEKFQELEQVQLWVRDSRTVAAAKRRCRRKSLNPALEYAELTYFCVFGGRRSNKYSLTSAGGCPFKVRLSTSLDGQALVVKEICHDHNHEPGKKLHEEPRPLYKSTTKRATTKPLHNIVNKQGGVADSSTKGGQESSEFHNQLEQSPFQQEDKQQEQQIKLQVQHCEDTECFNECIYKGQRMASDWMNVAQREGQKEDDINRPFKRKRKLDDLTEGPEIVERNITTETGNSSARMDDNSMYNQINDLSELLDGNQSILKKQDEKTADNLKSNTEIFDHLDLQSVCYSTKERMQELLFELDGEPDVFKEEVEGDSIMIESPTLESFEVNEGSQNVYPVHTYSQQVKDVDGALALQQSKIDNLLPLPSLHSIQSGSLCAPKPGAEELNVLPAVMTPFPQESSLQTDEKQSLSLAEVQNSVDSWQEVFPWVLYSDMNQLLICDYCKWRKDIGDRHKVHSLIDSSSLHSAARTLRIHGETKEHKLMAEKHEQIKRLINLLCPLLKLHVSHLSGYQSLADAVAHLNAGSFPGPSKRFHDRSNFILYTVRSIYRSIEKVVLQSLMKSPAFSLIEWDNESIGLVRFLNEAGDCEEHILIGQRKGDINKPLLQFLQEKSVNMDNLVYYTKLTDHTLCQEDQVLPITIPSFQRLLSTLENNDFFNNLFTSLELLVKIHKMSPDCFSHIPNIDKLMTLQEPYSHGCVCDQDILQLFYENFFNLRLIALNIHTQSGNNDAFKFSNLASNFHPSLKIAMIILPKLYDITQGNHSSPDTMIKQILFFLFKKLNCSNRKDPGEEQAYKLIIKFIYFLDKALTATKDVDALFFTQSLKDMTVFQMERALGKYLKGYKNQHQEIVQRLHVMRKTIQRGRDCNLLEILQGFERDKVLCKFFPGLHKFYLHLKVVPIMPIKVKRDLFDIVSTVQDFRSLYGKYALLFSYIYLEGPAAQNMDKKVIMKEFYHNLQHA